MIEALGIASGEQEWLDFLDSPENQNAHYQSLSPLLLRALNTAAEKRRVAETVLLASWALADIPLQDINPQDVAVIVNVMNEIGQTRTGRMFATEVVIYLLSHFSEIVPPMSDLSSSVLQDQTVAIVNDSLAALNEDTGESMHAQDGTSGITGSTNEIRFSGPPLIIQTNRNDYTAGNSR